MWTNSEREAKAHYKSSWMAKAYAQGYQLWNQSLQLTITKVITATYLESCYKSIHKQTKCTEVSDKLSIICYNGCVCKLNKHVCKLESLQILRSYSWLLSFTFSWDSYQKRKKHIPNRQFFKNKYKKYLILIYEFKRILLKIYECLKSYDLKLKAEMSDM